MKKTIVSELSKSSDFAMHFRFKGLEEKIIEDEGIDSDIGAQSDLGNDKGKRRKVS